MNEFKLNNIWMNLNQKQSCRPKKITKTKNGNKTKIPSNQVKKKQNKRKTDMSQPKGACKSDHDIGIC